MPEKWGPDEYTDAQVNELAEWIEDLTFRQLFFLKETYGAYLNGQAMEVGNNHVH